ncbi:MAG TPA: VWA domain-containing protein [Bryobacteraceae bacterium]|jgi:VWFA-related protein|nr:VWA domain-containing protein [Bryobacteraceae bacterium]
MISRRAFAFAAAALARAQVSVAPRPRPPAPQEQSPKPNIRVETSLVLIPVSVNDPLNRPVTGLEKENFRVFDDRVEQAITQFAMEDEPVAVGLVFDTSGSMGGKLRRSRMAAREFFNTSNGDEDEFFLVEFDDRPRLEVPLTRDTGEIETQLTFSRSHGSTALLDAILLALHEMHKSKKRKKALLIISDGGDNHSRYTPREVENVIRESDVLIYAIGVFGGGTTPEEAGGPGLLSHIAESTGGRLYEALPNDMPDIAKKIGIDLRNRYVLGYSPANPVRDGRYHRVDVRVVPPRGLPKLRAHWRTGYYAPVD